MKKFYFDPINGRKSFYGKCYCVESELSYTLFSYETKILEIDKYNFKPLNKIESSYLTTTTLTHLKAFLEFIGAVNNGLILTKKELILKYC